MQHTILRDIISNEHKETLMTSRLNYWTVCATVLYTSAKYLSLFAWLTKQKEKNVQFMVEFMVQFMVSCEEEKKHFQVINQPIHASIEDIIL